MLYKRRLIMQECSTVQTASAMYARMTCHFYFMGIWSMPGKLKHDKKKNIICKAIKYNHLKRQDTFKHNRNNITFIVFRFPGVQFRSHRVN